MFLKCLWEAGFLTFALIGQASRTLQQICRDRAGSALAGRGNFARVGFLAAGGIIIHLQKARAAENAISLVSCGRTAPGLAAHRRG